MSATSTKSWTTAPTWPLPEDISPMYFRVWRIFFQSNCNGGADPSIQCLSDRSPSGWSSGYVCKHSWKRAKHPNVSSGRLSNLILKNWVSQKCKQPVLKREWEVAQIEGYILMDIKVDAVGVVVEGSSNFCVCIDMSVCIRPSMHRRLQVAVLNCFALFSPPGLYISGSRIWNVTTHICA
jgi:hypothetical protein